MPRNLPRGWWVLCVLGALQADAWAFVPGATHLMEQMASQRSSVAVNRWRIVLQCAQAGQTAAQEILYIKVPGMVRRDHAEGSVEICRDGRCALKKGTEPAATAQPSYYELFRFLAEVPENAGTYLEWLDSLKVQRAVNTLTRSHGRIAVILGAKAWEGDKPQLWIDKDRFLPLRLIFRDGKSVVDLQWSDWGGKTSGNGVPALFEVYKDGALIERCEVVESKPGASIPDNLFH